MVAAGLSTPARAEVERLLSAQQWRVGEFARLYSLPRVGYEAMVYPQWSARDVLAHVVSWHESFARNIAALAAGRKPTPLRGRLQEINDREVEANRGASKAALLRRLGAAQHTMEKHIFDESIGLIPYRQGGRPYDRAEHLAVVTDHICAHQWHVVRALLTRQTV